MNDYNIERRAIHKGLEYIVVAYSGGWRCGYVKIPATRRMYGKGYTQSIVVDRQYESLEYLLDVHGGLTFAGRSTRFGRGWWLGFDCAHSGDGKDFDIMSDDIKAYYGSVPVFLSEGVIRSTEYVESECKRLIGQILNYY